MDRQYIQDHQVVERYLQGKLSTDEEEAFEEAYLGDSELLDELQRVQAMRQAVKDLDRHGELERYKPSPGWLAPFQSPQYAAAASVALVVSLLISGALYLDNQNLRGGGLVANVPVANVLPLITTRGNESPNQLAAPDSDALTVLLVDAGFDEYDSYLATISRGGDDAREVVVTRDGLSLNYDGTVALAVPGQLLTPGEYEIELSGRRNDWPPERDSVEITRVSLSVITP